MQALPKKEHEYKSKEEIATMQLSYEMAQGIISTNFVAELPDMPVV